MAKYCPLFSGSSGNCMYIATAGGGILIDAGVSAKRIETALRDRGVDPTTLRAIFVTHEHIDHAAGVRVLAKRYRLPVYASEGTLRGIEQSLDPSTTLWLMPKSGAEVAGMTVRAFALSHDARQPTGYTVTFADGRRMAIATDTGVITDEIRRELTGCELVMLESNHDVGMLHNGSYPYSLKQRILGNQGHLSNDACAAMLPYLVSAGSGYLILGHLSRENNTPSIALRTSHAALARAGMADRLDYRLTVAAPVSEEPVKIF